MKRKYIQIDEINLSDLDNYPIWEYLSEDDPKAKDECTIKGHDNNLKNIKSICIIKSNFIFNDGSVYIGYVRPEKGLSNSQPVIIVKDKYIYFWGGMREKTREEKDQKYIILNKKPEEIFPITWKTVIKTNMIDSGIIQGFGHLNLMDMDKEIYTK